MPPCRGPDTFDPLCCQRMFGVGSPEAMHTRVKDFPSYTEMIVALMGEEIDGLTEHWEQKKLCHLRKLHFVLKQNETPVHSCLLS